MVKVVLWGGLREHAGGETDLDIEADNLQQVVTRLGREHPGLQPHLEANVSIAVDGQIYRDSLFVPLKADAEVFILPKLSGG